MRFTRKKKLMYNYWNDTNKDVTKFLWFPITLYGETRWLETATIRYMVKREYSVFVGDYYYYWDAKEFLNE